MIRHERENAIKTHKVTELGIELEIKEKIISEKNSKLERTQ